MKKGNTEGSKAAAKVRVEDGKMLLEGVDKELINDDNDDGNVSLDDALKELKASAQEEVLDDEQDVSNPDDKVADDEESNNDNNSEDEGKKLSFNKFKELERKNKEIYEDKVKLEERLARLEGAMQHNQENFKGVEQYSDEWYEKISEKYNIPLESVKGFIQLNEDAFKTSPIAKELVEIRKELSEIKTSEFKKTEKGKLETNKLYSILKDDIEELLESDEIKSLPEKLRYRHAYLEAKERNESKISETLKNVGKPRNGGRTVIPSVGSTVGVRVIPRTGGMKLDSDDVRFARKLGHRTVKDIEELDNVPDTWVEK